MDKQQENLIGFYRRMLDAMPGLVFVKDAEGRFIECNRAYVAYMGAASTAEILGKTDFDFYPKDLAERFAVDDRRVMNSPSGELLEFVQTAPGPDGRVRHLRMRKQRTLDARGRLCLLGTALDQTDIQEALERAVKAEKAKSYFFSTVSHDIRTPLNSIVGFAQLLKAGLRGTAERKRALEALVTSSQTLLQLIGDVLDFSRLEAGAVKLERVTTDVGALVEETTEAFAPLLEEKGLALVRRVAKMPLVEIDAVHVRQVLSNLLSNAVKFTERGRVEVLADYAASRLTFTIRDTGCGIAPLDQPRISDPYVQAGNGRHGGTGLGLAIVKELVQRMGGSLSIESAVGVGSAFTVILPGVRPSSARSRAAYTAAAKAQPVALSPEERKTKKVMLVDDSKLNLIVLKNLLMRLGYERFTLAGNGREAFEQLLASPDCDLVLTDVWMSEMNGRELARAIAGEPRLANVRVYAVTADPEVRADPADQGFVGVFQKPVTLEMLGKAL